MINKSVIDQITTTIDKTSTLPLYLQIKNIIKEKVDSGEMEAGEMLPSELMLCDLLKVSRSPIRDAMEKLQGEGYIIRIQGKGTFISDVNDHAVSKCHNKMIGFVKPGLEGSSYAEHLLFGLEEEITRKDYSLLVGFSKNHPETERRIIDRFIRIGVDVLIFFPTTKWHEHPEQVISFQAAGGKVILVDRRPSGNDFNYVGSDNNGGGYTCARHFSNRGYHNVAYCCEYPNISAVDERISGFVKGAENYGLTVINSILTSSSEFSVENNCYKPKIFLEHLDVMKSNAPVGILAENDSIAINLKNQLESAGLKIGVDFGLIGFENSERAKYQTPTLTSVSQNGKLMGQTIAAMTVDLLEKQQTTKIHHILPTQLIVRESCKIQKNQESYIFSPPQQIE
jgi:GntR family transcriptional regulator, arabinose operon transcriptional repressor